MEIPLNILHNYIGAPIFGWLAFDTFRRNREKNSTTATYFGWTALFGSLTMLFFGYPVLFTHDTGVLSLGTFIGDCFYAIAMLLLWFIYIRVSLSNRPRLRKTASALVLLLTVIVLAEAVYRNFILSDSTYVSQAGNTIALMYNDTLLYRIVNGLDSLALIFASVYFWRHGKEAQTLGQRMRIRGLAISFTIFALSFPITPSFPIEQQARVNFAILLLGMIIITISTILGSLLYRRVKGVQPQ